MSKELLSAVLSNDRDTGRAIFQTRMDEAKTELKQDVAKRLFN